MSITTLTTADLRAFALERLGELLVKAELRAQEARAMDGAEASWRCVGSLDMLIQQSSQVVALAHVCYRHGDQAAHDAIFEAWNDTGERLLALSAAARAATISRGDL